MDYRRNRRFTELLNTVSGDYARSEIVDILEVCLRNMKPTNNYTIYINNHEPRNTPPPQNTRSITTAIDSLIETLVQEMEQGGDRQTRVNVQGDRNAYEVVFQDSNSSEGPNAETSTTQESTEIPITETGDNTPSDTLSNTASDNVNGQATTTSSTSRITPDV